MSEKVQAVPEGYRTLSPSLTCKNAAAAIDFYKKVFGAKENVRMMGPNNSVMHADLLHLAHALDDIERQVTKS